MAGVGRTAPDCWDHPHWRNIAPVDPLTDPTIRAMAGTYRFVFSEAMRAHWAERLRGESPERFVAAMEEVVAEATAARIRIDPTGEIASGAGDVVFYRAKLRIEDGLVCFDKPNGARVVLRKPTGNAIVALEPGKPAMEFERVEG